MLSYMVLIKLKWWLNLRKERSIPKGETVWVHLEGEMWAEPLKRGFREKVLKRGTLFVGRIGEKKHRDGNQTSCVEKKNELQAERSRLAPSIKPGMNQTVAPFHERKKNEHGNHINQLVFCFQRQFPEQINYFIK